MDTIRPGRRRTAAWLAGVVSLAMLLAAGCGGDRPDGQIVAGGVASTTSTETTTPLDGTTATSKKATSRTTTESGSASTGSTGGSVAGGSASTRRPTAPTRPRPGSTAGKPGTTKPTAPSKPPPAKVKLTLTIKNNGNVTGEVTVSPGGTCSSTCTFNLPKGESVALKPTPIEDHVQWAIGGAQTTCAPASTCELKELNADTSVQAIFTKQGGG